MNQNRLIMGLLLLLFILFSIEVGTGIYYYRLQTKRLINIKGFQNYLQRKVKKVENFLETLDQKLQSNQERVRNLIEELSSQKQKNEKTLSKVRNLETDLKKLSQDYQKSLKEIENLKLTLQDFFKKLHKEKQTLKQGGVDLGEVPVKKPSKE